MLDESYWSTQRDRVCLEPGITYLNTGSYSPLPIPVRDRLAELREQLACSPSDFFWRRMPGLFDAARARLSAYLSCRAEDLVLLPNVTHAINLAAWSLELPTGSHVLMTDQEYGAMRFLWQHLAKRQQLAVRAVAIPRRPTDPGEIVDRIARAIEPQTSVLFFSHVTSPTGLVLPAADLCRLAAEKGIVSVVDGAHAPGMVPLDLGAIGADFYAGNCHKWLMAPSGAGFLAVRPSLRRWVRPLVTSWGYDYDWTRADEPSGWGASFWARNLEFHGTVDRSPLMVLPEVLDFRESIGAEPIACRTRELVCHVRELLSDIGLEPVTPGEPSLSGSMTAFAVPPIDVVKARDWIFRQHHIECPFTQVGPDCYLRVSTAWFNTKTELERLAEVMAQFPVDRLQ